MFFAVQRRGLSLVTTAHYDSKCKLTIALDSRKTAIGPCVGVCALVVLWLSHDKLCAQDFVVAHMP